MPELNSMQFRFFPAEPKSMGGSPYHVLEAWHPKDASSPLSQVPSGSQRHALIQGGEKEVSPRGVFAWRHSTGEIRNVEVKPLNRRQGLATELFQRANSIAGQTRGVKPPRHSPDRTEAGDAWARSLGGRLPRRVQ